MEGFGSSPPADSFLPNGILIRVTGAECSLTDYKVSKNYVSGRSKEMVQLVSRVSGPEIAGL